VKDALVIAGLVVAVLVVSMVIWFAANIFSQETAPFRGETSKRNQVEANGQYRIAAYDHFKDLCATVQTDKQTITNTQGQLDLSTDPAQKQALSLFLLAQNNKLAEDVNQYNADASKSYTLGQFRDSSLPYKLYIEGETQCQL